MFIGGYWEDRKESKASGAARIASFLAAIREPRAEFDNWFRLGKSRADALTSLIAIDVASIAHEMKQNRRDSDRKPIVELGFSFWAWNGKEASFSAHVGGWGEWVSNAVILTTGIEFPDSDYREMLGHMVTAFDPDHAVVTKSAWLPDTPQTNPWDVGLFTFHRGGTIQQHVVPGHATK